MLASVYSKLKDVKTMFLFFIPIIFLLIFFLIISTKYDIPIQLFFRDPAASFNAPPYVGALSSIGILIWGATIAICLFSFFLLKKALSPIRTMLLWSGLFSGVLLFDDLFMLHESMTMDLFGISEKYIFAAYIVIFLAYAIYFSKTILKSNFILLLFALILLGGSLMFDVGLDFIADYVPFLHDIMKDFLDHERFVFLIEDGLKLLGITSWFLYFTKLAFDQINIEMRENGGVSS